MASAVTDATFTSEVTQTPGFVLVDFWAEWCGPCRMLAPVVESVSKTFAGKLKVLKLDTDSNPNVSQQYRISSIPCCILFKDGIEVAKIIGFKNEVAFTAELNKYIV